MFLSVCVGRFSVLALPAFLLCVACVNIAFRLAGNIASYGFPLMSDLVQGLGTDDVVSMLQQDRLRWCGHVLQEKGPILVG